MEAKGTRRRWTYSEFARLPSEGSTRYEVIAGELVVTPGPSGQHQRVVGRLFAALFGFVEAHELGEVFPGPFDVLFAEGDYLEPDIVFVGKDRSHLVSDRGVEGPPDLVVEVLSPSTATRDRGIKLDRYRHFGVPEYWVVDPEERTVEAWDLAGGTTQPVALGADDTLPWTPSGASATLTIALQDLFATK
jgi:Uma2 family endonuclease